MPRNYGQRLCPRCAQHCPCHYAGRVCPITDEIRAALKAYAVENGPRWKAKLCAEWERACSGVSDIDVRALLQQARNILGPSRLYKIKLPK